METKTCTACKLPKGLSDFTIRRDAKDGLMSRCRACKTLENQRYNIDNREDKAAKFSAWKVSRAINTPFYLLHRNSVGNGLNSKADKGRTDLILPEEIETLYHDQDGLCAYTGKPMLLELLARVGHPHSPSVERLDCSEAHTVANCVLTLRWVNITRRALDLRTYIEYLDMVPGEVVPGFERPEKVVRALSTLRSKGVA